MKSMRIPTPSERAAYERTSREHALVCVQMRAAASRAYDAAMKPVYEAERAGKIDIPTFTRIMAKEVRSRDIVMQKADKVYDLVMKEAWRKYILGEQIEQKAEQLALW